MKFEADQNVAGHQDGEALLTLPTRIICYAWGEKYVDDLLSLTIPAALAPGNLPYIASQVPCELVILTEERLFSRVRGHPAIVRTMSFCPLRLIALDDLILSKDKYGMALTFALHRGFADLGAAMTDNWQIFLNADFILADGSLRSVLTRLRRGERIVAAPSYCVVSSAVIPRLRERLDAQSNVLAISPREMAGMAMKHRHNTIRGKTINERTIHMRYMDQFYWEVDENTLVGHQMPIAIVGMRPERHLTDPGTFWDYGLMKEFCPEAEFHVIGDSDEFLMIELREKEVAEEHMKPSWPAASEIAEHMVVFLTEYQKEFAKYQLTLHATDLPADVNFGRQKLRKFIDEVFSYLPGFLASHIGHPQWDYHLPDFMKVRHNFLSERLGALTESAPPTETLSASDRLWWEYDGLVKAYERQKAELKAQKERAFECIMRMVEKEFQVGRAKLDEALNYAAQSDVPGTTRLDNMLFASELFGSIEGGRKGDETLVEKYWQGVSELSGRYRRRQEEFVPLLREIERCHDQGSKNLEFTLGRRMHELATQYSKLIEKRVTSAATPYIEIIQQSKESVTSRAPQKVLGARALYRKVLGYGPFQTFLSPYYALYLHFNRRLSEILAAPSLNCLVIASRSSGYEALLTNTAGRHVLVSPDGIKTGNLSRAFKELSKFDVCIFENPSDEIAEFLEIVDLARPQMRPGGTIVGFLKTIHPSNKSDIRLTLMRGLERHGDQAKFLFSGSLASSRVVAIYRRNLSKLVANSRLGVVKFSIVLALLQPFVWIANIIDARKTRIQLAQPNSASTSAVVEIVVGVTGPH